MQYFNTKLFTYDLALKMLCVDRSDLGRDFNQHQLVSVFNPRTGDEIRWGHSRNIMSREGEVTGWILVPFDADVNNFPHLSGWEITVWND